MIGGFVCPISGLVFAYVASLILPLDTMQFGVLVLFSALPPAVLNYLFAERYHQQPELVASTVLLGHAMAIVILSIVLWWLI